MNANKGCHWLILTQQLQIGSAGWANDDDGRVPESDGNPLCLSVHLA